MEEMTAAVVGATAGLAIAGRGLKPAAKLAMRAAVAAGDVTMDARRGIVDLYAEVKSERRSDPPPLPLRPAAE